jgi:homoserine kinase
MLNNEITQVSSFAPATCANVAVGFDILGFAFDSVGDTVTLTKRKDTEIVLEEITSPEKLPLDIQKNTATAVMQKLLQDLNIKCGFSVKIKKGIPLGSGMGGSAASAVAALVALNAFLKTPLPLHELAYYSLFGEEVACGQKHPDNIVPCLYGGVTLTRSINPVDVIELPSPNLFCILIHPHLKVETKHARGILKPNIPLTDFVRQSANLASFISALYQNNHSLIKSSVKDIVIEPQRAQLVPGFYEVQNAAFHAGALACSFSGSGPSLFAFSETKEEAIHIESAMKKIFLKNKIESESWSSPMKSKGAYVIS